MLIDFFQLQKYLHEEILDQIAPLIDLRRWLSYLDVSQTSTSQRPVAVEIIPEVFLDSIKKLFICIEISNYNKLIL